MSDSELWRKSEEITLLREEIIEKADATAKLREEIIADNAAIAKLRGDLFEARQAALKEGIEADKLRHALKLIKGAGYTLTLSDGTNVIEQALSSREGGAIIASFGDKLPPELPSREGGA